MIEISVACNIEAHTAGFRTVEVAEAIWNCAAVRIRAYAVSSSASDGNTPVLQIKHEKTPPVAGLCKIYDGQVAWIEKQTLIPKNIIALYGKPECPFVTACLGEKTAVIGSSNMLPLRPGSEK
jgi:hypothetical protein